jgi:hypothetical protein
MTMNRTLSLLQILTAPFVLAQSPYKDQATSTFSMTQKGPSKVVQISNVSYELTGKLVLRKTTKTKYTLDEIDVDAVTEVSAWPIGTPFTQKPIYTIREQGVDPAKIGDELIQISRGLEDVEWWSLYSLATGAHLFDTYTPLEQFSISRENLIRRFAGLDVPTDDIKDARLKDPKAVAVVTYASADRVIREALITADDPKQAVLLRSLADSNRRVEPIEQDSAVHALRITIRQNYPSPPNPVSITIPIANDDLDLTKAQLPAKMHVTAFKR